MKIKLIRNMTKDIAAEVWRASRSQDVPTDGVHLIDAPVNDFPAVTLGIECTIAEREVFVTFRDHVMWARTSRVDNPLEYVVDEHFDPEEFEYFRKAMLVLKEQGDSQDEYRLDLPLIAMTSFTCQISARTLIKIWHTFNDLCDDAMDDRLYAMYGKAATELMKIIEHIGYKDATRSIRPVEAFPDIENGAGGRVGDMLTVYIPDAPIALRAQVIRHRSLFVKDMMRDILNKAHKFSIGQRVPIQISADIDTWRGIISKRQCWLAQHDLWKPVVDQVAMTMGNMHMLPCSAKTGLAICPYNEDAELRYTSADPNPPCPMHAYLTDADFTDHKEDALEMVERDNRPAFWYSIIASTRVDR